MAVSDIMIYILTSLLVSSGIFSDSQRFWDFQEMRIFFLSVLKIFQFLTFFNFWDFFGISRKSRDFSIPWDFFGIFIPDFLKKSHGIFFPWDWDFFSWDGKSHKKATSGTLAKSACTL